jgi:phosphoribosylformylglycinamidine synthase
VKLATAHAVCSAHDVSDGGLAIAVAESCFNSVDSDGHCLSADIEIPSNAAELALFGESGARAVVSLSPASLARVNEIAAQCRVRVQRIGTVIRGEFRIQHNGALVIEGKVESFHRIWSESLGQSIEGGS